MTEEEQELIILRVQKGYKEAKKTLAALQIRCDEIAETARGLADALQSPTHVTVVLPGQSGVVLNPTAEHYMYSAAASRLLSLEYVREQVELYRSTKQRKEELRRNLMALEEADPGE